MPLSEVRHTQTSNTFISRAHPIYLTANIMASRPFGFRNVELIKNDTLGVGSYGMVVRAKCDGLQCAAKIIHRNLIDKMNIGAAGVQRKFEEECYLLSSARHPNVVQYLGTYCDPGTNLPILLMELCDESLRRFLERSPQQLPYHIQLNIAQDIALALVYLHQNDLIHRDLTSNNILMIAGVRAKVTDFGMSKIIRVEPNSILTLCPGSEFYMPPEALNVPVSYTHKLDVFSFGVLLIQIMTNQFPKPSPRFQQITCSIPNYPEGSVSMAVSETERRASHLQMITDTHPLKAIALNCLKGKEERQSAQQLNCTLSVLKQAPEYTESLQHPQSGMMTQKEIDCLKMEMLEIRHSHRDEVEKKERLIYQIQSEMRQHVQQLHQQLQANTRELQLAHNTILEQATVLDRKEAALQEKVRECQGKDSACEELVAQFQQSLEEKERTISKMQKIISALKEKNQQPQHQQQDKLEASDKQAQMLHMVTKKTLETGAAALDINNLRWEDGRKAPEPMRRGAAVVHGNTVYISCSTSLKTYCCQCTTLQWSWTTLPNRQYYRSSLAVVDGTLTSIGGRQDTCTNALFSLTGEGKRRKWSTVFPGMPTARCATVTITTQRSLIVAGGCNARKNLNIVEVMDVPTKRWTAVSCLPHPFAMASAALCGDKLYLAGGYNELGEESNSVMTCCITYLLSPLSLGARLRSLSLTNKTGGVWRRARDLPVTESTLITLGGHLLALGGKAGEDTTTVHCYHSHADSWHVVSDMNNTRRRCLASVLPDNRLVVVGGYDNDTVEIAILH